MYYKINMCKSNCPWEKCRTYQDICDLGVKIVDSKLFCAPFGWNYQESRKNIYEEDTPVSTLININKNGFVTRMSQPGIICEPYNKNCLTRTIQRAMVGGLIKRSEALAIMNYCSNNPKYKNEFIFKTFDGEQVTYKNGSQGVTENITENIMTSPLFKNENEPSDESLNKIQEFENSLSTIYPVGKIRPVYKIVNKFYGCNCGEKGKTFHFLTYFDTYDFWSCFKNIIPDSLFNRYKSLVVGFSIMDSTWNRNTLLWNMLDEYYIQKIKKQKRKI